MATKSITLEKDAYERLKRARLSGETFSQVVLRAFPEKKSVTGAELLEFLKKGGARVSDDYLNSIEQASKHDPVPDNPWD